MILVSDIVLVKYGTFMSINTGKTCVHAVNLSMCENVTVKNRVEKKAFICHYTPARQKFKGQVEGQSCSAAAAVSTVTWLYISICKK